MVAVSSCCCCCSLRTGTLVIGWLGVIACSLSILTVAMQFFDLDQLEQVMDQFYPNCSRQEACLKPVYDAAIGTFSVSIGVDSIAVAVSALLIYAVFKSQPCLMTPYIVFTIIGTVLMVLVTMLTIVMLVWGSAVAAVAIALLAISIGLNVHFILVVWSYRTEVRESQTLSPLQLQEEGLEAKLCKQ